MHYSHSPVIHYAIFHKRYSTYTVNSFTSRLIFPALILAVSRQGAFIAKVCSSVQKMHGRKNHHLRWRIWSFLRSPIQMRILRMGQIKRLCQSRKFPTKRDGCPDGRLFDGCLVSRSVLSRKLTLAAETASAGEYLPGLDKSSATSRKFETRRDLCHDGCSFDCWLFCRSFYVRHA